MCLFFFYHVSLIHPFFFQNVSIFERQKIYNAGEPASSYTIINKKGNKLP
jgi:hypothetical protein